MTIPCELLCKACEKLGWNGAAMVSAVSQRQRPQLFGKGVFSWVGVLVENHYSSPWIRTNQPSMHPVQSACSHNSHRSKPEGQTRKRLA